MPVTEFAILSLRRGHDQLELLETLMQCQELQDEWMHRNQPCSVEPNVNFSSMYFERPDPDHAPAPSLLITAPWESAEAHGEWIQCRENQACNGKLSEYLVPGCDSVLLFHMEPAGTQTQIRRAFFSQGTFNVCRISIDSSQRDPLQQAYRSLEDDLVGRGVYDEVWAGWKLETSGDAHDFVVFWSDNVPSERLRHLMSFSDNKVHHRFRHVV
ncbi:hypothetical protein HRG_000599 [Hirsutella rhossiliensis]|uniref:Uncharacterized protein n=1 Tax=Hirsutella rhossiliensis TaxID=111463 RepID=A0A9P8N7G8_9HYPO|nr:uncharacterized protein HRG_00599 [Hirsutella rhossiliensis]KAH0967957.1 hypothetical protein HRG_00599 [Hirsutella rhossiliensis]